MEVCTIIAKNYVAFARVLARSLAEHNPGSRLWTLVIDDFEGYIDPAQEPFELLTPADVGCQPFQFMALRYSVLELSTAVKPWLLRHLLERTDGPVTYLDPDIRVYESLAPLDELAAAHGLVVIPHTSQPVPADGRNPSQVDIMIAGVYNLGYVSLAATPEVNELLDWWSDRLRRDCRVDPVWGYFVDQRWFDLVPGFVSDFAIVREPQFNLAYWNLHGRQLDHGAGGYTVDGRPLAFFHFSGFDPERPLSLSRHQNRIDVTAAPGLERLLAEYAREVMDAGHEVSRRWPYSYSSLGDGTQIDDLVRAMCDEFEDDLQRRGEAVPSPFTPAGAKAFRVWLGEDAPGLPGINRVLARTYQDRRDLQAAFPDPSGSGRQGLLEWMAEYGRDEVPLLAKILPPDSEPRRPAPAPLVPLPEGPWGVNVAGRFRSSHEAGELARALVRALDAGGVPVAPVEDPTAGSSPSESFATLPAEAAPYPVNLLVVPGDELGGFAAHAGDALLGGRYTVGVWLSPSAQGAADAQSILQELWVPSEQIALGLRDQVAIPVHVLPLAVEPEPFAVPERTSLGLPDDAFVCLAGFEDAQELERADVARVMEAFERAFADVASARLLIAAIDPGPGTRFDALRALCADHGRVRLIDGPLTRADLLGLISACDCYVSPSGSRGIGLARAQAGWLGIPVIAETDAERAASAMWRLFDSPAEARAMAARAAAELRREHSADAVAQAVIRRLESIRVSGLVPGAPLGGRAPSAVVAGLLEIPSGPRGGRAYRLRRVLRAAILRTLRPYTDYQHKVNLGLIGLVDQLHGERALERAQWLTELRGARQLRTAIEVQARAVDDLRRRAGLESDRALYLALGELAQRHQAIGPAPAAPDPAPAAQASAPGLAGFELRGYSQNGEDGVLAEILRRIGAAGRFFVEFGVESGAEGNCVYLADVAGWDGLFMEADERFYRLLARKYAPRPGIQTLQAFVSAENIEQLLEQSGAPPEPDVMSIDVDGQDYWIFEALTRFRPRVVVIEYNSALDPQRRLVQPRELNAWDGTDYFGASLGAVRQLAEQKGYRLVHAELAGANAFLVREELAAGRFPEPDQVLLHGAPNYYQSGHRHPHDELDRPYLDLDSGEMVPASR